MRTEKFGLLLAALLLPGPVLAAESGVALDDANTDIHNLASLQRGARNFVNYCMGCHSAQYMRWNRMAADLGIPEDVLAKELMITGGSPHDTMKTAMPAKLGETWFGKAPPDLSLMARARGTDYIYTFLRGYYADPGRPIGVNNTVLANTAMPHVLAHLQGLRQPRYELRSVEGGAEPVLVGFDPGTPGELTEAEYDEFVRDTVNFLDYVGEPVKAKRERMGVWVVLFLLVFWLLAWLLKREYWKDVK
jgi:ubiquinol-cytochrome c reductase cytochrome c1 subunit